MSKKVTASSKTYQIRPPFKDKFRPGVSSSSFQRMNVGSQGEDRENSKGEAEECAIQLSGTASVDEGHCG